MEERTGPVERALDVICLGRLGVDLYAQQVGARLEDASTFAKYLGGSSANIAFGCARLGLRTALASRVGDDAMGRFLLETLAAERVDVSHVSIDPGRLTALVLLGIQDRDTFPHTSTASTARTWRWRSGTSTRPSSARPAPWSSPAPTSPPSTPTASARSRSTARAATG
jgi:sugar/nucleoside kinase (ribokinase family)